MAVSHPLAANGVAVSKIAPMELHEAFGALLTIATLAIIKVLAELVALLVINSRDVWRERKFAHRRRRLARAGLVEDDETSSSEGVAPRSNSPVGSWGGGIEA